MNSKMREDESPPVLFRVNRPLLSIEPCSCSVNSPFCNLIYKTDVNRNSECTGNGKASAQKTVTVVRRKW